MATGLDFKQHPSTTFKSLDELTRQEAEDEIRALREGIEYHNYCYYVENQPDISDARPPVTTGYATSQSALGIGLEVSIMKHLVTNRDYRRFVDATGHRAPDVERQTWRRYGLIHPYARTRRHAWVEGQPPAARLDHPVVLVSRVDANAHAAWLSLQLGETWRLPTELEWEKAARGTGGRWFPWGQTWQPALANTHDLGPFDTLPVESFPRGKSPFGLLDPVGQVFEWTADVTVQGRVVVKGAGSWDDKGCGVCRPASRHTRPAALKHILVGFRLVRVVKQ